MMRAIPSEPTVAPFTPPDGATFRARIQRLGTVFVDAYYEQRERYGVTIAPCDDPLLTAYCRLDSAYQTRIDKLERALVHALACDALTDEDRARIVAARGIRASDAKLLSAAETQHLVEYRALDDADRRIVRALIARLSQGGHAMSRTIRTATPQRARAHADLHTVYRALRSLSPEAYGPLSRMILSTAAAEQSHPKPRQRGTRVAGATVIRLVPTRGPDHDQCPLTSALMPRLRQLERICPSSLTSITGLVEYFLDIAAEAR